MMSERVKEKMAAQEAAQQEWDNRTEVSRESGVSRISMKSRAVAEEMLEMNPVRDEPLKLIPESHTSTNTTQLTRYELVLTNCPHDVSESPKDSFKGLPHGSGRQDGTHLRSYGPKQ